MLVMSVQALRHLMTSMRGGLHQFIADSFYEVLLNARVHVPLQREGVIWVHGPSGQHALPVFLDRESLAAFGGATDDRVLSMPQAAAVAARAKDAWLVVDFGSPLNQPIARAGVEALANQSYPGAERYAQQWALVNELAAALRRGGLDPGLRRRAEEQRFYTLGEATGGGAASPRDPRVFEVQGMSVLSVRGPAEQSYLPAWPSPGGSFEFMPFSQHRLVVPLARLVQGALSLKRGLVLGLPSPYIHLPFPELSALWSDAGH